MIHTSIPIFSAAYENVADGSSGARADGKRLKTGCWSSRKYFRNPCDSVRGGASHILDDQHLDRSLCGNQPQAELLLEKGENGWAIRLPDGIRGGFQGDVEDARDSGSVHHRELNALQERQLFRELRHGGVAEYEAAIFHARQRLGAVRGHKPVSFRRRKPGTAAGSLVYGQHQGLPPEPELESFGQQILEHDAELADRHGRPDRGLEVVAFVIQKGRTGELIGPDDVGPPHAVARGNVPHIERPHREAFRRVFNARALASLASGPREFRGLDGGNVELRRAG